MERIQLQLRQLVRLQQQLAPGPLLLAEEQQQCLWQLKSLAILRWPPALVAVLLVYQAQAPREWFLLVPQEPEVWASESVPVLQPRLHVWIL